MIERKSGRILGLAVAAGLLAAVTAGTALAQSAAQKAVTARIESYKQLGGAFKTINDELKTKSPDMPKIAAAATKMRDLSGKIPGWFPKGSGAESGAKTRAKAEIWTDAAGFAAAQRGLQSETSKLVTLASAGDLSGLRDQVKATGGSCKSCHDKYRAPEK